MIEGFNKHFKRYTKRKEQFPTVDSLERFIVARSNQYNEKHSLHIHKGFNKVQRELDSLFEKLYQ
jgi:transposase-like protein